MISQNAERRSQNFNQGLTALQSRNDMRHNGLEPGKQIAAARVRRPDLNHRRPAPAQYFPLREVLIFYDYYRSVCHRIGPNCRVRHSLHPNIADMLCLMPLVSNPPGKSGWKLCVNEETHYATRSTG